MKAPNAEINIPKRLLLLKLSKKFDQILGIDF